MEGRVRRACTLSCKDPFFMLQLTLGDWSIQVRRRPLAAAGLTAMYNDQASAWHSTVTRLGYLAAYRGLFERLVAARELPVLGQTARVLDAGIGSGAFSLALAETVGARFQLDGVDIAPQMLPEARRRLCAVGLTPVLQTERIEQLPFADHSFDAVISAHALEHVPDLSATMGELTRVLRPGAPLVLVVTRPGWATTWLRMRWNAQPYAPGAMLSAMADAGLRHCRLAPLQGGIAQRWSCAYIGWAK